MNTDNYPNVFIFLCGLTRLVSSEISQFICKMLQDTCSRAVTAVKCVYEGQQTSAPQSTTSLRLNFNSTTLQPYDCLCVSYVLSCYPVVKLKMEGCYIGDNSAEILIKHYPNSCRDCVLQELILSDNCLTVTGLEHVLKVITKS